jgi:hypothetical protein
MHKPNVPGDQEGLFKLAVQLRKFFNSVIYIVVFNDIRAASMTACWHHWVFQFSNFEFPNLAIYPDAAN